MSAISTFEIQEHKKHIDIILYPEVIDADWSSIEAFGSKVITQLKGRPKPACIVDLSKLSYMGSSLVALIVRIWKEVKLTEGKMIVVSPHPVVSQVIVLAGLDKLWRIVPHINLALKELGAPIPAPVQAQGFLGTQAGEASESKDHLKFLWPILGVLVVIIVISILIIKTLNETS